MSSRCSLRARVGHAPADGGAPASEPRRRGLFATRRLPEEREVEPVESLPKRVFQRPKARIRVGIVGGNGFIGRHVATAIVKAGGHAIVLGRHMNPDAHVDGAEYVCTVFDALHPKVEHLMGLHVLVNLVGLKTEANGQSFESAHVRAVEALVKAAALARIVRFVHVSVAGARHDEASPYLSTKADGEQVVRDSLLAEYATIVRPGVVYGDGDDAITNLVASVTHIGVFPAPDGGKAPLMFVDVLDVAEAIATVAMQVDGKFEGKTVDVVGPSEMDVRSFLDVVSAGARLRTTYAIPFPSWVLKRAAAAMEQLMDRPAITQAQLHLLSTGVVGDVEQTTSLLGRAPRRLTEERVRRIVERSPPEPLFGVSFRPVWHPQHFSYLEPYARAHRSLLFALPLGLTLGVVGPFFMTQGQVAACLAAISAPATLPTLHWLLLPGPLTLVYGTTSALGVSIFCHKGPPYFGFGLINQMHSGVLGKISLGWGSRYILGHTRTWEEDWPVLLLVTFAEELWRARIALPIAANSRPELGVLLSAVFFILCGAPHGTAVHAGVAGLILGFLTVRTQGILAPFITRYLGIALYIVSLGY